MVGLWIRHDMDSCVSEAIGNRPRVLAKQGEYSIGQYRASQENESAGLDPGKCSASADSFFTDHGQILEMLSTLVCTCAAVE